MATVIFDMWFNWPNYWAFAVIVAVALASLTEAEHLLLQIMGRD